MSFDYKEYSTHSVEGKRIYQIEDNFYPSITTVLGGTQSAEKIQSLQNWKNRLGHKEAEKVTNSAAARGTNMHLMLERALGGKDPKLEEFPVEHVNIFKSLRLEITKINKVYGQEIVLFSDVLGVAGRCDLIGEYKGEMAIVDYKSSTRAKSADEIGDYWLQTSFYAIAHNEMFGTKIEKLVILMGVENKLPMVFKKTLDENLVLDLIERTEKFYKEV